ncbi:MAG: ABC transporter ATP-binding protein [Desulfomonilaceae bacterium]|nr:ABC transporter ATP-binding protein [Desulfomonilaceae bacterium]
MIEVERLRCGYGSRDVIKGISLKVGTGEMTGILGPNGSGKTTLMLAMAGVIPPREGTVRVCGEDILVKGARWTARQAASVPQRSETSFPFKCLSLVLMGRYPYLNGWGTYSEEDMNAALEAMESTETMHLAHRKVREVSGGEAQMITIARAFAQQTGILLLDEATSSLDAAHKMRIFDVLREKNLRGATILCIMHDLNLAALYCTRLIFLKNGEIALDGKTEEVFTDEYLSQIYETEIRVAGHPVTGAPQAHFVPRAHGHVDPGSVG